MIREILKRFLNPDNTKNYLLDKYISSFDLLWLKMIIKKDKISKTDLINFFLSKQYHSLKIFQIKYFYLFIKLWNKFTNFTIEKIIIKIIYKEYLRSISTKKMSFHEFKKKMYEYFFYYVSFIDQLNQFYQSFVLKNKKMNKFLTKLKDISILLKNENIERGKKNNLIDEIGSINKKHQKLFYSSKYDNVIMYYQKLLLKLDSFIFNKNNIFMLSNVNYGYLNAFLVSIKYNFKTKGNIYKSQIFETFMLLSNFSRLMDRYGFKTTYNDTKNITIDNTNYILEEFN